jgi:hypothetical protein
MKVCHQATSLLDVALNFEVNMDFMHKAHFVTGGHMINPPPFLAHSNVMSQDGVRLALFYLQL